MAEDCLHEFVTVEYWYNYDIEENLISKSSKTLICLKCNRLTHFDIRPNKFVGWKTPEAKRCQHRYAAVEWRYGYVRTEIKKKVRILKKTFLHRERVTRFLCVSCWEIKDINFLTMR
jgi:hypothetical protein